MVNKTGGIPNTQNVSNGVYVNMLTATKQKKRGVLEKLEGAWCSIEDKERSRLEEVQHPQQQIEQKMHSQAVGVFFSLLTICYLKNAFLTTLFLSPIFPPFIQKPEYCLPSAL